MKKGDEVFYIETNNSIRKATVVSISGDFVTLRYGTTDSHYISGGKHHLESSGGIRLRKSKLFLSKEEAEKSINDKKAAEQRIAKNREIEHILQTFK